MKEIVTRLHENRQIQLAKEILESAGYEVVKESVEMPCSEVISNADAIENDSGYVR